MDLQQYFATQCRASSVILKTHSPSIKATVQGKKRRRTGTVGTLSFDGFCVDIMYLESGRSAYAQQTIWLSFVLDCDTTLPYSVYDILAFLEPDNFNCYTYTYVDSQELMGNCFGEINALLQRLAPKLSKFLKDGVNKNRLIDTQRKAVNKYFGDSVIESSELIGAAADNIINMMLRNFHEAQIEAAVIGGQSLFYAGKDEKALKKLKKAKYLTLYHTNLIAFLENGGTSEGITLTAREASAEKGALRHGHGLSGCLKIIGLALCIDIPVTVVMIAVFYIACSIMFKNSLFYTGFYENIFLMPFFGSLLSVGISLQVLNHSRKDSSKDKKSKKAVHSLPVTNSMKTFYKCFTIVGECLAILGCLTSIYSTTVFYEDRMCYSEADFPTSHSICQYSSIEAIALVNGITQNEKFHPQKHIAIVTKSGSVIDLYNSTCLSGEDAVRSFTLAEDYDIEIITVNTIDDLK